MEPNVAYQINDVCFMISFPSLIGSLIYINIYKRESIKQAEFTEIQDNFLNDRQPTT